MYLTYLDALSKKIAEVFYHTRTYSIANLDKCLLAIVAVVAITGTGSLAYIASSATNTSLPSAFQTDKIETQAIPANIEIPFRITEPSSPLGFLETEQIYRSDDVNVNSTFYLFTMLRGSNASFNFTINTMKATCRPPVPRAANCMSPEFPLDIDLNLTLRRITGDLPLTYRGVHRQLPRQYDFLEPSSSSEDVSVTLSPYPKVLRLNDTVTIRVTLTAKPNASKGFHYGSLDAKILNDPRHFGLGMGPYFFLRIADPQLAAKHAEPSNQALPYLAIGMTVIPVGIILLLVRQRKKHRVNAI